MSARTGWTRDGAGLLATAVNVARQDDATRLALADPFVGELVEVRYSYSRNAAEARAITGRVITVARMADGAGEVLTVAPYPSAVPTRAIAVKLATVVSIRQLVPTEEASR